MEDLYISELKVLKVMAMFALKKCKIQYYELHYRGSLDRRLRECFSGVKLALAPQLFIMKSYYQLEDFLI